jgi:hypothetical protein
LGIVDEDCSFWWLANEQLVLNTQPQVSRKLRHIRSAFGSGVADQVLKILYQDLELQKELLDSK